jgi:hypothetical protein
MQMRNAQLINDLTSLHHFLVQLGHDGWWSLCIYSTSIYLYATIFNPHRSISKQEQTQRTHLRSCPWAAPWGPKKRPWRVFRSCCPREVCVVLGIGWRDSVHRVLGRYFTLGGRDYLASVDQWKLLKVNQRQYIYYIYIILYNYKSIWVTGYKTHVDGWIFGLGMLTTFAPCLQGSAWVSLEAPSSMAPSRKTSVRQGTRFF